MFSNQSGYRILSDSKATSSALSCSFQALNPASRDVCKAFLVRSCAAAMNCSTVVPFTCSGLTHGPASRWTKGGEVCDCFEGFKCFPHDVLICCSLKQHYILNRFLFNLSVSHLMNRFNFRWWCPHETLFVEIKLWYLWSLVSIYYKYQMPHSMHSFWLTLNDDLQKLPEVQITFWILWFFKCSIWSIDLAYNFESWYP